MPEVTPLHYITKRPLTDLDRRNIKAAKQQVTDRLAKLVPGTDGAEHVLAFGYTEKDDLPTGVTVHMVDSAHHGSLVSALDRIFNGMDEEWETAVWNIEMIGGR